MLEKIQGVYSKFTHLFTVLNLCCSMDLSWRVEGFIWVVGVNLDCRVDLGGRVDLVCRVEFGLV